jgi:hypothetical protein
MILALFFLKFYNIKDILWQHTPLSIQADHLLEKA